MSAGLDLDFGFDDEAPGAPAATDFGFDDDDTEDFGFDTADLDGADDPTGGPRLAPGGINSDLLDARHARAKALLDIHLGARTVFDVFAATETDAGRPLRALRLALMLHEIPGVGDARVRQVIYDTVRASATRTTARRGSDSSVARVLAGDTTALKLLDVDWLLDPRVAGARFAAFCDAYVRHVPLLDPRLARPLDAPTRAALMAVPRVGGGTSSSGQAWDGFPFTPMPVTWAQGSDGDPR